MGAKKNIMNINILMTLGFLRENKHHNTVGEVVSVGKIVIVVAISVSAVVVVVCVASVVLRTSLAGRMGRVCLDGVEVTMDI